MTTQTAIIYQWYFYLKIAYEIANPLTARNFTFSKLCIITLFILVFSANSYSQVINLTPKTDLIFAKLPEARRIITANDDYVKAMNGFDRSTRVKTDNFISKKEYIRILSNQVLEWNSHDIKRIKSLIESFQQNFNNYAIPLPTNVYFIKTSGMEDGGTAYTRQNAIFLPINILAKSNWLLTQIIIHELFHIMSRNDLDVKRKLYSIIGFYPLSAKISLAKNLDSIRITNPDAIDIQYYMNVSYKGKKIQVMPFTYSNDDYDIVLGGGVFRYLRFGLLRLKNENGQQSIHLVKGKAHIINVHEVSGFYEQIGRNTHYIIHPEEILADNFIYLIQDIQSLPSLWVVQKMKHALIKNSQRQYSRLTRGQSLKTVPKETKNLEMETFNRIKNSNQSQSKDNGIELPGNQKKLNLKDQQLSVVPKGLSTLNKLTMLNLTSNQLTRIPGKIGQLRNLKFLLLGSNYLTTLTKETRNLGNREMLGLDNNKLSSLINIRFVTNLKVLNLGKNN